MFSFLRKNKPKTPTPDRRASLRSIPVLDPDVTIEEGTAGDRGLVLVSQRPRRASSWLARQFTPSVIERRIELDELGAFVVRLFDGERDVATIAENFAESFKVSRREAELSTATFIKRLAQRRMAVIALRS